MNKPIYNRMSNNSPMYYVQSKSKYKYKSKQQSKRFYYKYVFIITIILISIALLYLIVEKTIKLKNENISKSFKSKYSVISLYSNTLPNMSRKIIRTTSENNPFIIGLIQIDKINISYPILSSTSPELLKLSPCRFARANAK